jgi:hypothetical protein
MAYEGRIFVNWTEAAEILGTDSEGLRQLFLFRLRSRNTDESKPWLRLHLHAHGDGFMTRLVRSDEEVKSDINWRDRDSFYRATEGKQVIQFSDGLTLPLEYPQGWIDAATGMDQISECSWYASHGYGCGYSKCFAVSGTTLVVQPVDVAVACEQGGRAASVVVAPRDACKRGFPSWGFDVVNCENSTYKARPINLIDDAQFLRLDVLEIRDALSETAMKPKPVESGRPMRTDKEENYLRIIAGLWARSELSMKPYTAAEELHSELSQWDWDKPGTDTIATVLIKAAGLAKGKHPNFR